MFLLNIATPWVRTGRHADYVTYYKPVRPNYIRHGYITMRKVLFLVEALTLSAPSVCALNAPINLSIAGV